MVSKRSKEEILLAANPNLLKNTDFTRDFSSWTTTFQMTDDKRVVVDNSEVSGFYKIAQIEIENSNRGLEQRGLVLPAGTYTISGWLKSSVSGKDYIQVNINTNGVSSYPKTSYATTTWSRVQGTFTLTGESTVTVRLGRGSGDTTATTLSAVGIKLEEGSVVTDWVPGTEPNLIRNSTFLNGSTYWNYYPSTIDTYISREIIDDLSSPSSKAMHIKRDSSGGIYQSYQNVGLTIGKTYTLSLITKGTGQLLYGWEGGKAPLVNLTDQYQHISYTFTYASDRNFSFYVNGGGEVYLHSIKIEEGSYATDFIAAQVDINEGKDRPVIAMSQYTIVDYNDKVSLVSTIASNLDNTQQYSPSEERFIPDWTQTNLVLTASLYKGDSETNIINSGDVTSIKWYKLSILDGKKPVPLSNGADYSILGNKLTVTQNVLNDKDSIDFICEITYKDPLTTETLLAKSTITFSRVRNGGSLTKAVASLPNGNSLQNNKALAYKENDSYVGRNLQRYTDYITAGSSQWAWNGPTGSTVGLRTVVKEPTAPTGYAMEITYPETLTSSAGTHKRPISKLTAGVTYSWSVWIKASRDIPMIGVGSEQGGTKNIALTTTWQKFTHTFTANNSSIWSFVFYMIPTADDKIWIHSLKLEEGGTPTEWSMAPEDIPMIDQALGQNNWVLRKFPSPKNETYVPTYVDITGKRYSIKQTNADTKDLFTENGEVSTPYIGHLQTSVYSDKEIDLPLTFQQGVPVTIYSNNEIARKESLNLVKDSESSLTVVNATTSVNKTFAHSITVDDLMSNSFTISADIDITNATKGRSGRIGAEFNVKYTDGTFDYFGAWEYGFTDEAPVTTKKRISRTYSALDTKGKTIEAINSVGIYIQCGGIATISNPKLELGANYKTTWTPSYSDTRNLLPDSAKEKTSSNEFVRYADIAPIIDTYGLVPYTISFDIKGSVDGTARVYMQNGSSFKYSFTGYAPVTTSYVRQKITVTPRLNTPEEPQSFLAFYTTYGTGCIPSVKNVKIELGDTGSTIPAYTPAYEDKIQSASIPLKQGWNTIDILWNSHTRTKNGIWNITAGGKNLFLDSKTMSKYRVGSDNSNQSSVSGVLTDPVVGEYQTVTFKNYGNIYWYPKFNETLLAGKEYTISLDIKTDTTYGFYWYPGSGKSVRHVYSKNSDKCIPNTNGEWQRWSFTYTAIADGVFGGPDATGLFGFSEAHSGAQIAFKNLKLEQTGVATPWTPAPEDVSGSTPNIFSKAMQGLNAFYSTEFETQLSALVATCQLMRGSIVDTTNVSYQWYKQDATITSDQGGGIGWMKLTGTSSETGYLSDALIIPADAIGSIEYYKCIIRDTQVDSVTYNGYFSSIVSVSNVAMPIEVRVEANGTIILNGQGTKSLTARLYQMGSEIDPRGDEYTYKWYRYLSNGTKDSAWAGGIGFKTGKTLTITGDDVATKATFAVEIE